MTKTNDFEKLPADSTLQPESATVTDLTPNTYLWPKFGLKDGGDFVTGQHLIAESGEATLKTGCAYSVYSCTKDMPAQTAYFNSDGDDLIIPQAGTLNIQTELGRLLVRNNEICVLPRGIRYRVTLPDGHARGYICTLFQGHFELPNLGAIGSTGLANPRDFQIPKAWFDGHVVDAVALPEVPGQEWDVLTRFNRKLWKATQDHTPFDVVAWNGTYYPYKYDLGRFSVLGSLLFDHPDPSLFTVLTAPSYRIPGHAVVDFAIIPPRWVVMEDTYYLPYYHRNTQPEFAGMIIRDQEDPAESPWSGPGEFRPLGAILMNSMVTHGATKEAHEAATERSTEPEKIDDMPFYVFLLETENMMKVTEFGRGLSVSMTKPGKAKGKVSKL